MVTQEDLQTLAKYGYNKVSKDFIQRANDLYKARSLFVTKKHIKLMLLYIGNIAKHHCIDAIKQIKSGIIKYDGISDSEMTELGSRLKNNASVIFYPALSDAMYKLLYPIALLFLKGRYEQVGRLFKMRNKPIFYQSDNHNTLTCSICGSVIPLNADWQTTKVMTVKIDKNKRICSCSKCNATFHALIQSNSRELKQLLEIQNNYKQVYLNEYINSPYPITYDALYLMHANFIHVLYQIPYRALSRIIETQVYSPQHALYVNLNTIYKPLVSVLQQSPFVSLFVSDSWFMPNIREIYSGLIPKTYLDLHAIQTENFIGNYFETVASSNAFIEYALQSWVTQFEPQHYNYFNQLSSWGNGYKHFYRTLMASRHGVIEQAGQPIKPPMQSLFNLFS